jgi:uncharacterized protein YecE (DUF72 family)
MVKNKLIHIGTSGWNYKHWREAFFPKDLPTKEWLSYYVQKFHTVEINNSFYQLPTAETFQNWYKKTPDDFIFSVKASRYITHMKKLNEPKEALRNFMDRVSILREKLGPILFQLPPRWKCNEDRLANFIQLLPKDLRYTFEFRDQSWWNTEIYNILNEYNIAFCIYELAGTLAPKQVTADFVYIRLHGPGDKYQGSYDQDILAGWMGAFSSWVKQGKEIFCYFDNDENGYAAQNAQSLQSMINGK